MITEWLQAAMRRAEYKLIENEPPWYGEIPECECVWAVGTNVENCREELRATVEDWLLLGVRLGHAIPVFDGIDLSPIDDPSTVAPERVRFL